MTLRTPSKSLLIFLGLVIAVTNLDEVVALIRSAPNPATAREKLLTREWPIGDIASQGYSLSIPLYVKRTAMLRRGNAGF